MAKFGTVNWLDPFETDYKFMRVSRTTGQEIEPVTNITGGSITRNQDTSIYESASLDFVGSLDIGADYLRVYLLATATNGTWATEEPLGTFLVSTPKTSGSIKSGTADCYGKLQELADDDFDTAYAIGAGSNTIEAARSICEGAGLTVIADSSTHTLGTQWVFAPGNDGDNPSTKLEAVNKLLAVAGFNAAWTDALGQVHFTKTTANDNKGVTWDFESGTQCRFLADKEEELDSFSVYNVVHADFTTQDSTIRGVAEDKSDGPWSISSLGRRKVKNYSYNDTATQAEANAKAEELLAQRSLIHRVTWTNIYAPVKCRDLVHFKSTRNGIDSRFSIRTMDIKLDHGAPMTIEGREFINS